MTGILIAAGVLAALIILYFLGPKPDLNLQMPDIVLPDDLDAYLAEQESRFDDIIDGADKMVRWYQDKREKTSYSFVYFHGYTACRQEMEPVISSAADAVGANVFFMRIQGHGRSDQSFGEYTLEGAVRDAAEALEIGKRIGDKVLVMGTSTGAPLALWAAYHRQEQIAGSINFSANFKPRALGVELLWRPWGKQLARIIGGKEHRWKPDNEYQEKYWTNVQPIEATIPMMATAVMGRSLPLESFPAPVLFLYTEKDDKVSVDMIKKQFIRFPESSRGVNKELIEVPGAEYHNLAGYICSPDTVPFVRDRVIEFIQKI